jgi:hypothetical protein
MAPSTSTSIRRSSRAPKPKVIFEAKSQISRVRKITRSAKPRLVGQNASLGEHVDLDALDKQISRIDHTYTTFTTTPTIPTTRNTQVAEVADAITLFSRRCNRNRAPLRLRLSREMLQDEEVLEALELAGKLELARGMEMGDEEWSLGWVVGPKGQEV